MADSGSHRHQQQSPRPRWGSLVNERIFLDLLDGDQANRFEPEATSLKLVNSNLYARRHSAHTAAITNRNEYPTTETYKQEKQVSMPPPIPQRPPAVPKRNCVTASVKRLVDSQPKSQNQSRRQPTTEKSAAQPPPIPPSSKNRQLPPIPTTYKLPTPLTPPPLRSQEQQLLLQMNSKFVHDCPVIEQSSKLHENDVTSSTVQTNNNKHYNKEPTVGVKSSTRCPAGTQQQTTITKKDQPHIRQDSSISSDSFSQTSSPSYTTKTMETPLLPPPAKTHGKRRGTVSAISVAAAVGARRNRTGSHNAATVFADDATGNTNAITKSASTPASLQTVVKFHDGSNMSLHHKIIRDMKRPSSVYDRRLRLRFRFAQLVLNAVALFAIGAGMAVYFRAYPTASTQPAMQLAVNASASKNVFVMAGINPAPGICLPVIVSFCLHHKVPYNFTVFPNYMGHFGQRDAESELEIYDAVVDVRCYELAALFLCSLFVPKCGNHGSVIRPCRNICQETKRRCGFFLDVFGLTLPDYLDCGLFPDYTNKTRCVGHHEFMKAKMRAQIPVCPSGFQCDRRRCIPKDWLCDGHIDCQDQTDELSCNKCGEGMVHCGEDRCITREHMCDGVVDCPWGQDERNCLRLSERNGDVGVGQLEVYRADQEKWMPACIEYWDQDTSPQAICSLLGYSNLTRSMLWRGPNRNNSPPAHESDLWKMRQSVRPGNMIKEFTICNRTSDYHTVELECTDYVCGKARKSYAERRSLRIVGGVKSRPGDWPFLAALLGGPEEVFYCAGVLIADQWVLTASHCVGNHSNVTNWTIQLGITRRHAHSFYGQKMKVKRVVPHPMYNVDVAHDNDVALFQLAHRVTFHEHLLPVCLPEAGKKLIPGTVCTVIGWGKKEDTGLSEYEPEVNEVQVPVLDRETCNTWLQRRDLNVTDGMICAGYKDGGKDACQGDSGGPLLCRDDKDPERWFVGGIVSWGIKCAHPELPGVYAYVPKYIPWIRSKMSLYSSD